MTGPRDPRLMHRETFCGGDSPTKMSLIMEATRRTDWAMLNHPCGCSVCRADALLYHLREVRAENGLLPTSGRPARSS